LNVALNLLARVVKGQVVTGIDVTP
jgi:hypothetical protein